MKHVLLPLALSTLAFMTPVHSKQNLAVAENTASYSTKFTSEESGFDIIYLQADGTFALGDNFGISVGANNLYLDSSDYNGNSDNIQNLRLGGFYRHSDHGRVELSYQQLFRDGDNDGLYSITGEYYFKHWTLGTYAMSDDLLDLNDLNIYANIYFTDNIRLEVDLLDASDNSIVSATVNFQAPEYIGNAWQFNLSFGEGFGRDTTQWGIGVKYTPNFDDTLKRFYRSYGTNVKSFFFL